MMRGGNSEGCLVGLGARVFERDDRRVGEGQKRGGEKQQEYVVYMYRVTWVGTSTGLDEGR